MSTRSRLFIGTLSILTLAIPSAANAALIGVDPKFPSIAYGSQGTMTYDAAADVFSVSSFPAAILFSEGSPVRPVVASAAVPAQAVVIQIKVDGTGSLIGGVPGDDLLVTGAVDADGNGSIDYTGILLTGEVLAFGHEDTGTPTDMFDFIFSATGGALAPLFGNNNVGVILTAESSTFSGSFAVSFASTKTKGEIGPVPPECGDGIKDPGEQCDDGNNMNGDGCSAKCMLEECGNAIVDPGESCDDGNTNNNDGCRNNCTKCGDNILDSGETCDDGNTNNSDGCRNNCTQCGDNILDSGETCDDGNTNNSDGCRNNCTKCGDNILDSGESCDDGNTNNTDGCRNNCTKCGDSILDAGESCDDGNTNNSDDCRNNCTKCGDSLVNGGETCDDGNTNNNDTCRNNCTKCGDSVVDSGETCDDGNTNNTDGCRNNCTKCGDNILDSGETCDDGNTNNTDGCRNNCTKCGDSVLDSGESCDDGNTNNSDGCRNNCTKCGDSVVDSGETCDDGNTNNTDGCRNNCTKCGDNILDSGETCDDGNTNNTDDCRNNCTKCGDTVLDPGEACDDGNTNDFDGCRNNCTKCGDGVVDPGELCDDGNTNNDDGCRNNCTKCGDGVVDTNETCDDGNTNNTDGCRNNCTKCGDSVVNGGETCDDGNTNNNDGCRNNCTKCGDSVVDTGETCDDGNTNNTDGCRNNCTKCGDNVVNPGETCDDGNTNNSDGCRNNCTKCGDGNLDAGEQCDDGNQVNGDGCQNNCTPTLGGCCVDAQCLVLSRADCIGRQGEFLGLNTNCEGVTCGEEGACCKNDVCKELTEEECLAEQGEFFGPGTTCVPAPDSINDPGRYRLLHTQDTGEKHPPAYGLRLDGLFGDYPNVYTFSFVLPGTAMYLDYDGSTICIHGIAYGGKDVGTSWSATKQSFVEVHVVYGDVEVVGNSLRVPKGAPTAGTIKWLATGQVIPLSGKDNGVIIFEFDLVSGEGWLMYETGSPGCCQDFKFNDIDPIPSCPPQTGACCLVDSGLCFTISRECCEGIGGEYAGDDTTCEEIKCADPPKCGDGVKEGNEECDDGDRDNYDDCRNNCTLPRCGDGIKSQGEECDDGNTINGDGCSSTCDKEDDCVCDMHNKPPRIDCPPDTTCDCDLLTLECHCDSGEPKVEDDCDPEPVVTHRDEFVEEPEHLTSGEVPQSIHHWRTQRSPRSKGSRGSVGVREAQLGQDRATPNDSRMEGLSSLALLEVPHADNMKLADGAIALRFRFDGSVRGAGLLSKDGAGYGQGGHLRISTTSDGRVQARLQSATDSYLAETAPFIRPDQSYHVAFTFGSQGMRLYIDGELGATNAYTGGTRGNNQPIVLGALNSEIETGGPSDVSGRFQGTLDDVRMFDHDLTDDQVEILRKDEEEEDECTEIHRIWKARDSCGEKSQCTQIIRDPDCDEEEEEDEVTILFVVPDPANLDAKDQMRKDLIESWDFDVVLIDVDSSQAAFNTAAGSADAAYITEKILSTNLDTKLSNSGIGVVSEEGYVHDAFWMTPSNAGGYSGRRIDVVDGNHYITSVFDLGSLTILSEDQQLVEAVGALAGGVKVLGEKRETNIASLFVANTGGALHGGHTAAGRRVMLPWAKENFDFSKLNNNGKTLMRRSLEWAAGMD